MAGNRPWNAYIVRKYQRSDGEEGSEFLKVGVAFPLKERGGFSLTLHFTTLPSAEVIVLEPENDDRSEQRSEQRSDRGGSRRSDRR